jgi:undecaprenyl-diphosphatase
MLRAAAAHRSPGLNRVMTTASAVANRSMLWMALAGVLQATGRRRPRTAAASGLLGIGVAATLVNGPLKFAWRRDRPTGAGEPLLPLPLTFSFPSGHSASALAFAAGTTAAWPALGPLVVPTAATVAYSRVHTGVHYPSDVAVGAAVGLGSGLLAARMVQRLQQSSAHRVDAPSLDVRLPRRAVVVSSADSASADGLDLALRELAAAAVTVEQRLDVTEVDALATLVSRHGGGLVVAAGGDGTVNAVVNALADSQATLAIVPLGTSNDVARSLGIPPDPVEAARVIAGGRVCTVDAARARFADGTTRLFLNAATAGLNVEFARAATKPALRGRFGRLTYPVAAARAVRAAEPFECTIECADRKTAVCVVHLSISNAPVFGGVLGMRVPGASITDGLLDVIAVERLSLARLVLAVADAVVGRHTPVHGVHAMRVRSVRVDSAGGEGIALDGEMSAAMPAQFDVQPGALRVVVPHE